MNFRIMGPTEPFVVERGLQSPPPHLSESTQTEVSECGRVESRAACDLPLLEAKYCPPVHATESTQTVVGSCWRVGRP